LEPREASQAAGPAALALLPRGWTASVRGDLSGGLVAAVVSIPMSMGFGILAFAPFGDAMLATGVLAGLYGAMFMGLVALVFGARTITIYAPRSLIAFMIGSIALHAFAESESELLAREPGLAAGALLGTLALAGLLQMVFGVARLGGLVRFIPSPVMAGFQNAAALLILVSQLHIMLGLPRRVAPEALPEALAAGKPLTLLVGLATVAVIWNGARISRRLPPALLGLFFGTALYYLLAALGLGASLGPTVGAIPDSMPDGRFLGSAIGFAARPEALELLPVIAASAFSLAVVASLDILICARIVEGLSGARTDGNRTLRIAGGANLVTPLLGGISGGVSIAASTANHRGGARSALSLLVHCVLIFAVVTAVGPLLAMLPLVVVGAVLVVTALQLVDRWSLDLVRKILSRRAVSWRAVAVDLAVIVVVALTAIAGDVVFAVLIGVAVAVVLFVLRMSRSIVRRELPGDVVRSRRTRDAAQMRVLAEHGRRIRVLELEGPVFFGSAESLGERIEAAVAAGARYLLLDFRRVNDLDSTGARILLQAHERLRAQGAFLALAGVDGAPLVSTGLRDAGVVAAVTPGRVFRDRDQALEWAENHLIEAVAPGHAPGVDYPFDRLDLVEGLSAAERELLRSLLVRRQYGPGEVVFREGAAGDELYVIASGSASVKVELAATGEQRLVSFGAGTVFGEMALLDRETRSATVQADEALECFVLERAAYQRIRDAHPELAIKLLAGLGRELSARLRRANRMLNQAES
jgi:MFS superfamily sulfate permease-like transporter